MKHKYVYMIQDINTKVIYGLFYSKKKAKKYAGEYPIVVRKLSII